MDQAGAGRPRPDARGAAAPYWRACAEGRLALPKCSACGELHWYPRVRCPYCGSAELTWIEASGTGTVHTYTVVRQSGDPYFRGKVPYVLAMIDLREDVRIMSNVVDCDVGDVQVGSRVRVHFEDLGDGVGIPLFRLAGESR